MRYNLLSFSDALILEFYDEPSYVPILEAAADISGEETDSDLDGRRTLDASIIALRTQTNKMEKWRELATKYGLDKQLKDDIIYVIGPERYHDIEYFSDPENIKKVVEADIARGVDTDKTRLELKYVKRGQLTIPELKLIFSRLKSNIAPKIDARELTFKTIEHKTPGISNLLKTKLDVDIELEYFSKAKGGKLTREVLSKKAPLGTRLKQFTNALHDVDINQHPEDPSLVPDLVKHFKGAYQKMFDALGKSDEFAIETVKDENGKPVIGPDGKPKVVDNNPQRVYTSTLYALCAVAPQFNETAIKNERDALKKKKEEEDKKKQAEAQEAAKKAEKQKEENEKLLRASLTNYYKYVEITIKSTPQVAKDNIIHMLNQPSPHYGGATRFKFKVTEDNLPECLKSLDHSNAPEDIRTAFQIRNTLGIKTKKDYDAWIASQVSSNIPESISVDEVDTIIESISQYLNSVI